MAFLIWLAVMVTIFIIIALARSSANSQSNHVSNTQAAPIITKPASNQNKPVLPKPIEKPVLDNLFLHKPLDRFDTIEAYHLRLRIDEAIESLKNQSKREQLNESRLYFEFEHVKSQSTYEIIVSFWPRMPHTPSSFTETYTIKLPEVVYKPMFMQLWYPLSLDEYPVASLGQTDKYPHELSALTAYLPTKEAVKRWEAKSK